MSLWKRELEGALTFSGGDQRDTKPFTSSPPSSQALLPLPLPLLMLMLLLPSLLMLLLLLKLPLHFLSILAPALFFSPLFSLMCCRCFSPTLWFNPSV